MSKSVKFLVCEPGDTNLQIIQAMSHKEAAQEYFARHDPFSPDVFVYQLADETPFEYTKEVKVRNVKR